MTTVLSRRLDWLVGIDSAPEWSFGHAHRRIATFFHGHLAA
jgi:hypothetical protein